jgi:hypothetical protein
VPGATARYEKNHEEEFVHVTYSSAAELARAGKPFMAAVTRATSTP